MKNENGLQRGILCLSVVVHVRMADRCSQKRSSLLLGMEIYHTWSAVLRLVLSREKRNECKAGRRGNLRIIKINRREIGGN